jgi:hypothetical protein
MSIWLHQEVHEEYMQEEEDPSNNSIQSFLLYELMLEVEVCDVITA